MSFVPAPALTSQQRFQLYEKERKLEQEILELKQARLNNVVDIKTIDKNLSSFLSETTEDDDMKAFREALKDIGDMSSSEDSCEGNDSGLYEEFDEDLYHEFTFKDNMPEILDLHSPNPTLARSTYDFSSTPQIAPENVLRKSFDGLPKGPMKPNVSSPSDPLCSISRSPTLPISSPTSSSSISQSLTQPPKPIPPKILKPTTKSPSMLSGSTTPPLHWHSSLIPSPPLHPGQPPKPTPPKTKPITKNHTSFGSSATIPSPPLKLAAKPTSNNLVKDNMIVEKSSLVKPVIAPKPKIAPKPSIKPKPLAKKTSHGATTLGMSSSSILTNTILSSSNSISNCLPSIRSVGQLPLDDIRDSGSLEEQIHFCQSEESDENGNLYDCLDTNQQMADHHRRLSEKIASEKSLTSQPQDEGEGDYIDGQDMDVIKSNLLAKMKSESPHVDEHVIEDFIGQRFLSLGNENNISGQRPVSFDISQWTAASGPTGCKLSSAPPSRPTTGPSRTPLRPKSGPSTPTKPLPNRPSNKNKFHCGVLKKKSGGQKRAPKWDIRWFEITPRFVHYYIKRGENKELKGSIFLGMKCHVQADQSDPDYKIFFIHTTKRKYQLRANSTEDRDVWIRSITQAMRLNA